VLYLNILSWLADYIKPCC